VVVDAIAALGRLTTSTTLDDRVRPANLEQPPLVVRDDHDEGIPRLYRRWRATDSELVGGGERTHVPPVGGVCTRHPQQVTVRVVELQGPADLLPDVQRVGEGAVR